MTNRPSINSLLDKMFDDKLKLDPEAQGASKISGSAWDCSFEMRTVHAVGNWYMEGFIEAERFRVFKTPEEVKIYVAREGHDFVTLSPSLIIKRCTKQELYEFLQERALKQKR